MKIWYAVDKYGQSALYFRKPHRAGYMWDDEDGFFFNPDSENNIIVENMPELLKQTWKDEPRELDLKCADTGKEMQPVTQILKNTVKNVLLVILIAVFYLAYLPVGMLRAAVDPDRFSDFLDTLGNITTDFRIAWKKVVGKQKGGKS